jgi:hypothetical protein
MITLFSLPSNLAVAGVSPLCGSNQVVQTLGEV